MSMPVPYQPPDYVPPEVAESRWSGPERRSGEPIDRLSRSLNRLCLEATDQYEIVAHLEALGFNSPNALAKLGVDDHFELAEALYVRTPKSVERSRPAFRHQRDWLGPAAMVLALAVTFLLGAYASSAVLAPALWVLVWSQVASTMLAKSFSELDEDQQGGVLALMMVLGVVGIGVVWIVADVGLQAAAPALLWCSTAGLIWARQYAAALVLPITIALAVALVPGGATSVSVGDVVTVALSGSLVLPLALGVRGSALAWTIRRAGTMLKPALYGMGQGLLIVSLVRSTPADAYVLPGALLLAAILLMSQSLLLQLKEALADQLWSTTSPAAFVGSMRRGLLAYAGVYLAPVALAGFVWLGFGPQSWFFHWIGFALFGLCLALAIVSLTLGNLSLPAVAFLAGGVASLYVPFLTVSALLAASLLLVLLVRSARFQRYALYLL